MAQNAIPMNAQCAVFAESEVISLIHSKIPVADICRAVIDAISDRVSSVVRRVGVEKDILLIGGMSHNPGFVSALREGLEVDLIVLDGEKQFVGALGAALAAQERGQ
jgi:benzoyl-CoA reductase subunit D